MRQKTSTKDNKREIKYKSCFHSSIPINTVKYNSHSMQIWYIVNKLPLYPLKFLMTSPIEPPLSNFPNKWGLWDPQGARQLIHISHMFPRCFQTILSPWDIAVPASEQAPLGIAQGHWAIATRVCKCSNLILVGRAPQSTSLNRELTKWFSEELQLGNYEGHIEVGA